MTNAKAVANAKPAYTLIKGADLITKAIESITRRGASLDKDIQIAALSAMDHHASHGDTTLINRLVAGMPKGSRVNALRAFIGNYGAVVYNEETKVFDHSKGAKFNLTGAMSIMWTEFKPEADYVPIADANALLHSLIARMQKDIEKVGDRSKVDAGVLAKLMALDTTPVKA